MNRYPSCESLKLDPERVVADSEVGKEFHSGLAEVGTDSLGDEIKSDT